MDSFAKLLARNAMPRLQGRMLWVLTDYSFDNPDSDYDVVGLLLVDPEASGRWKELRQAVRANILLDERRMSWKKLNSDSRRQAAFFPFLRAADHICGLALALAFQRGPTFEIPKKDLTKFRNSLHLSADWKPRNLQQAFRITYCTAIAVAGLSHPGQDIHWVSDQDSAFANETIEHDTVGLFARLLTIFLPHELGQVRYGTTAHGEEPLFQEDLAAIPDLMCGATCEIFTAIKREYRDIPQVYAKLPRLSNRSRQFLQWYASGQSPLKRYICVFESRNDRAPSVGILNPDLLERSGDVGVLLPH